MTLCIHFNNNDLNSMLLNFQAPFIVGFGGITMAHKWGSSASEIGCMSFYLYPMLCWADIKSYSALLCHPAVLHVLQPSYNSHVHIHFVPILDPTKIIGIIHFVQNILFRIPTKIYLNPIPVKTFTNNPTLL